MPCINRRAGAILRRCAESGLSGTVLSRRPLFTTRGTTAAQLRHGKFERLGPAAGSLGCSKSNNALPVCRSIYKRKAATITEESLEREEVPLEAMGGTSSTAADGIATAPGTQLPALSGPYQVSVADVEADIDNATVMRLFYPCDDEAPPRESYWLPSWRYAEGYGNYARLPAVLSVPAMMLAVGSARIPCADNRPLAVTCRSWQTGGQAGDSSGSGSLESEDAAKPTTLPSNPPPKFPVLIFSHGLAGMRTTYSSLCSDFASHGYIVAALEHRDGSACVTYKDGQKVSSSIVVFLTVLLGCPAGADCRQMLPSDSTPAHHQGVRGKRWQPELPPGAAPAACEGDARRP
mmetsp:Transcript_13844/g.39199  ORF Transcript_13844/g.39199 Transcript_13844/m.39199 type:complete len:349 (-) Transcript_13844:1308-2354(-)